MPVNPYESPKQSESDIAKESGKRTPLFWIVATSLALVVAAPALLALLFILVAWSSCSRPDSIP